jgi:hypothetical protein
MSNRYFSQKPRNCPVTSEDVELLEFKIILNLALQEGLALSYQDRIFMDRAGGGLTLFRKSEDESSIVLQPEKTAYAVDLFVQQFIFEAKLDLLALRVHAGDSTKAAISVHHIARKLTTDQLYRDTEEPVIMPVIASMISAEQHSH